jgi:hypothetical protein
MEAPGIGPQRVKPHKEFESFADLWSTLGSQDKTSSDKRRHQLDWRSWSQTNIGQAFDRHGSSSLSTFGNATRKSVVKLPAPPPTVNYLRLSIEVQGEHGKVSFAGTFVPRASCIIPSQMPGVCTISSDRSDEKEYMEHFEKIGRMRALDEEEYGDGLQALRRRRFTQTEYSHPWRAREKVVYLPRSGYRSYEAVSPIVLQQCCSNIN